jgi:hypothetical protein
MAMVFTTNLVKRAPYIHTKALSVRNISFQKLLESLLASALTVNPPGNPPVTSAEMPITIADIFKSAQDTM